MESEIKNNIETDNTDQFKMRRRNNGYLTGLILVLIGGALLVERMGVPVPEWLFTWPMLLIVIGIYSGIKHNFRNNTWIILLAIGGFFLVNDFMPELRLEPFFWPILIIAVGILFLVRPRNKEWTHYWDGNRGRYRRFRGSSSNTPWEEPVEDSSDYFNIHSVFSGVKRTVLSKNFKGGSVSCVFAGVEIDLTQADITDKVVIRLEEVFGGTKLIIPADWLVQNEIEGIFHGVDDKRAFRANVAPNANKVLILRGSAVFAGIEIRSY